MIKGSQPAREEWSDLLLLEAGRFRKAFIVVDALDECLDDGMRESFLSEMRRLQPAAHILITSRLTVPIETGFPGVIEAEIRASDGDMEKYLGSRVQTENRLVRLLRADVQLQATVVERIVKAAKGM